MKRRVEDEGGPHSGPPSSDAFDQLQPEVLPQPSQT